MEKELCKRKESKENRNKKCLQGKKSKGLKTKKGIKTCFEEETEQNKMLKTSPRKK